jgi:GNAT superfamily N-acetyltransferase
LIEQFTLSRLQPSSVIKPFDCGVSDLNKFLFDDAINHTLQLLAITYLLESPNETVAYFSVLNDSIRHKDSPGGQLSKIWELIPGPKNYKSHPAVKVGRFAVNNSYQSQGIGGELMDYIKGYFLDNNKTGYRFITVDANNNPRTIKFYINNGFNFLTKKDEKADNRLMYFDLILYTL